MILRLLWPIRRFGTGSPHLRSFLYFGDGIPCGVPGLGSKLLTPEFGSQIPIEEAVPHEASNVGERQFRCWTVRLLSMTLLVPLIQPPNYASSDEPYWKAKTISFPNMDGNGGMRAELDSASARTYVPLSVYNDIRRSWLQQPNVPSPQKCDRDIFQREAGCFRGHDIIFRFKGLDTEEVEFRCSAEHFLVSPWYKPKSGFIVPFKAIRPTGDEYGYLSEVVTLGMNFFWGAIVRFDAEHRGLRPVPGIDQPYVQLAAQRIVQDGKIVADAHEIEIHQDAPPRVQATARKQPSLLQ
uniref:Extracellular lipase (EC) n=1 Tax=Ganoderma boninense TaxID=34458 RepID=A0A5K1K346_9APHY|nr:Extracellular lipase (EC [Ganoderma boninense]